jgi:hypothetical protein
MPILSHRGWWLTDDEKNTEVAFVRSFAAGYGTETDLRDHEGTIVISHDPPSFSPRPVITLDRLLEIHAAHDPTLPLALNVKADGLQAKVAASLRHFGVRDAFMFDMAVPDALHYLRQGMTTFTRQSEVEPVPSFYAASHGVWVDGFDGEWFSEADIGQHLDAGKRVCIVSPDLHRRDPEPLWTRMKSWSFLRDPRLMLCTDFPDRARSVLLGSH